MRKIQVSNWSKDKQKVVYPYNGIALGQEKKWDSDTCFNMDGPLKDDANLKKSVKTDHSLYDSIYRKCPEWENPEREKD